MHTPRFFFCCGTTSEVASKIKNLLLHTHITVDYSSVNVSSSDLYDDICLVLRSER